LSEGSQGQGWFALLRFTQILLNSLIPKPYDFEIKTTGDHFRRKRLKMGLMQKEPAKLLRVNRFPELDTGDGSTVEQSLWSVPGKRSVVLYTIEGDRNGAPHPAKRGMRPLGNSNRGSHAANENWKLLQRKSP